MVRAICATVLGACATASRTSQRASVLPAGLAIASPAVVKSARSRMVGMIRSVRASPTGVRGLLSSGNLPACGRPGPLPMTGCCHFIEENLAAEPLADELHKAQLPSHSALTKIVNFGRPCRAPSLTYAAGWAAGRRGGLGAAGPARPLRF